MKTAQTFACEKCGQAFSSAATAAAHEKKCLSLKVGQTVKFMFGLVLEEGRITALGDTRGVPTVDIETDEILDDDAVDLLHDGKHVWVTRDQVTEIVRQAPRAAA